MVSLSQQDSVTITVSWCHYVIGIPTLSQMKKNKAAFYRLPLFFCGYILSLIHALVCNKRGVRVL